MKKQNISIYYILLLLPGIIVGSLLLLSYYLLSNIGEFKHTQEIARHTIKHQSHYGSALHNMTYQYKLALYNEIKPDIVAFGSSRVMQFNADSFNAPFVNMGGISGLQEALKLSKDMLKTHKPKTIIWGLDFWWFNEAYAEPASLPHHNRYMSQLAPSLDLLLKPYIWLIEEKFNIGEVSNLLLSNSDDNIGAVAKIKKDGYDAHGTYLYHAIPTGTLKSDDFQFKRDLDRVKSGEKIYQFASKISDDKWQQFLTTLYNFQQEGIDIILFTPPVASEIERAMKETKQFNILGELASRLTTLEPPFFNFHDALKSLGSSSCEFIDGHHGGAITYRRILIKMANASEQFESQLNLNNIGQVISRNSSYATHPHDDEIDFLGLGCAK